MSQEDATILVIEDDAAICKILAITLESVSYNVIVAQSGKEGIKATVSARPDLIVLDLKLPDLDGKQVISEIRQWSQAPIIVCSCVNKDKDIIEVLEAGADDYITKPFNSAVLIARIHANLRKSHYVEVDEPEIMNGIIRMNLASHEVYVNGIKSAFTTKEYELLHYFVAHRGKMLTHQNILRKIWGDAHAEDMQYVRIYVRQLRTKIEENPAIPRYIITVPGVGYRMENMEVVKNEMESRIQEAV